MTISVSLVGKVVGTPTLSTKTTFKMAELLVEVKDRNQRTLEDVFMTYPVACFGDLADKAMALTPGTTVDVLCKLTAKPTRQGDRHFLGLTASGIGIRQDLAASFQTPKTPEDVAQIPF